MSQSMESELTKALATRKGRRKKMSRKDRRKAKARMKNPKKEEPPPPETADIEAAVATDGTPRRNRRLPRPKALPRPKRIPSPQTRF